MRAVVNDSADTDSEPAPARSFSGELSHCSEDVGSESSRVLRGISSGRRGGIFGRRWSKGRVEWSDIAKQSHRQASNEGGLMKDLDENGERRLEGEGSDGRGMRMKDGGRGVRRSAQ